MQYQSENIDQLAAALAKAQGELEPAGKNSENTVGGGMKRKYADISAVYDAIRKVLPSSGLSVAQTMRPSESGTVCVHTMLMHTSGQWISGDCVLPCDRQSGPQGAGSAITYARRYSLSAIVGVVSEEDDDGAGAISSKNNSGKKDLQRKPKVDPPSTESNASPVGLASPNKIQRIQILFKEIGVTDRDERINQVNDWLKRGGKSPVDSTNELTEALATSLIKGLEKRKADIAPPVDDPFGPIYGAPGENSAAHFDNPNF